MKLERTLFQKSHFYFMGFFLLVIAAFWLTYFTRILDQENYRMHTHGISLILWCLMLIVQPYLIVTKRNEWHKSIGKLSYVLVPLLVFTTLDLLKFRFPQQSTALGAMDYFFIALVVNALIAFAVLYGLAIYNRKKPALHARFMICTILPMVTPATDRIISIYFPFIKPYLHLPTIEGHSITPAVGFVMADLLLIGLSIWDWRSHRRWDVFPSALMVLLLYHYSVLNFYKFQFWRSFCNWFMEL